MRRFVLIAAALIPLESMADAGVPCRPAEYARLKDSSKQELNEAFCSATKMASLNKDIHATNKELFERLLAMGANAKPAMQEMSESADAQIACERNAEDAAAVLSKKFRAKPPACR